LQLREFCKIVKGYIVNTLREIITEHINYRRQILQLAKTELIREYSGTALGWAWAVIRPGIFIAIYYVAFALGLRVSRDVGEYSYFQWLLAGLIPWFYIRDVFVSGAGSIRKHRYLVTKIKFPISVIPTFISLSEFLVNILLMALMLLYFVVTGKGPDLYWLQLPLYMLMLFFFFTLWSIFAGMLSTISKDFLQLVKSITMALFWLSGIIFDVSNVKNDLFQFILKLNPITTVINGCRNSLIYKEWFWENPGELLTFFLVSALMLILTVYVYGKLKDDIPDVL